MESIEDKVRRVTSEAFEIVEYDPEWPTRFERERQYLLDRIPDGTVLRIEHVGSTAVPGLAAKPIVDLLVGVDDLAVVREQVAPLLESEGYDYFWRPAHGDADPPFYAFFIKRNTRGARTHHIHVVTMDFAEHWDWVVFRDHLIAHPHVADEYARLKRRLAIEFANDRVGYTREKSSFITDVVRHAKRGARAEGDSEGESDSGARAP